MGKKGNKCSKTEKKDKIKITELKNKEIRFIR